MLKLFIKPTANGGPKKVFLQLLWSTNLKKPREILIINFYSIAVSDEGVIVVEVSLIDNSHQGVDEGIGSVFVFGTIPVAQLLKPDVKSSTFHQRIICFVELEVVHCLIVKQQQVLMVLTAIDGEIRVSQISGRFIYIVDAVIFTELVGFLKVLIAFLVFAKERQQQAVVCEVEKLFFACSLRWLFAECLQRAF